MRVVQYALLFAAIVFLLWLLQALEYTEKKAEVVFLSKCENGVSVNDALISKAEDYAKSYLEARVGDRIERYSFVNSSFDFETCKLRLNYVYTYRNLSIPMHLDVDILGTYVFRISDSSEIFLEPLDIEIFPWQVNAKKIIVKEDDIIYVTDLGNISAVERQQAIMDVLQ